MRVQDAIKKKSRLTGETREGRSKKRELALVVVGVFGSVLGSRNGSSQCF